MKHDPVMSTLNDALNWVRDRWDDQRAAPLRLHMARVIDSGGAPEWSGPFASILTWRPGQSRRQEVTIACGHPLNSGKAQQCPECDGVGIKTVVSDRYTYPMEVARRRLQRAKGGVRSDAIVFLLATFDWRVDVLRRLTGLKDEDILRAIRQLHGRYESGPIAWTSLSSSQQAAIEAGEVAA